MPRPPDCVVFVARTHGFVALVIIGSVALLHGLTRKLPGIDFEARTYLITGGLAAIYLLTAALVWLGAPLGRLSSRLCALIYLARPNFGSRIWDEMDSPEFQAHFKRRPGPNSPADGAETK